MKKFCVISILFLMSFHLFAGQSKLAVLNCTDQSGKIEQETLSTISEYIRMYMEGQARYEIIAKEKHDALDPALQNCKDKLCRIKAGQALNADLILYSKITPAGEDQYSVNVEIIDVAKKSAIISFDEKWNGDSESIDPLSEKIARKIAAKQANIDALNSTPMGTAANPANFQPINKDLALCNTARKNGNVKNWNIYLRKFPEGECKEEAKKALDNIACEAARKESNEKKWNQYLKDFPEGQCAEDAKAFFAGESSRKDKAACETARKKSNEKEWNQYLKDFPEGECKEEAKAFFADEPLRKDKAACETARKKSNEKEWNQYLKDFPEGECKEEAKTFIAGESSRKDKAACETAQKNGSLKSWEKYLEKYPDGSCSAQAKELIKKAQQEEEERKLKAAEKKKIEEENAKKHAEFKEELNNAGRKKRIATATGLFVPGMLLLGAGGGLFYVMYDADKKYKKYKSYYEDTVYFDLKKYYAKQANKQSDNALIFTIAGAVSAGAGAAMTIAGIVLYSMESEGEKEVKKKYNISFGANPAGTNLYFTLNW